MNCMFKINNTNNKYDINSPQAIKMALNQM